MVPEIVTIPQYFKNQGYNTIGLGKIFDPRCVDEFRDKPSWSVPFMPEHKFEYPNDFGPPAMGFYQDPKIKAHIQKLRNEAKANGVKNLGKYLRDTFKPPFEKTDAPDDMSMVLLVCMPINFLVNINQNTMNHSLVLI